MTDDTTPPFDLDAAAPPETEAEPTPEQSIAIIVEHRPEIVLIDEKKRDELFAHIESEVVAFEHDLTTTAGREATRKFAAKITRTKTAADKAGLALTEDARAKIKTINDARNVVKEKLDKLAEQARQPLTDWEQAEEKRLAHCETELAALTRAGVVTVDATAEDVRGRIAELEAKELAPAEWLALLEPALKARNHSLELLRQGLAGIEQREAQAKELEELRAAAAARAAEDAARAEREAKEREERENAEAEERRKQEEAEETAEVARQAEERRLQEEQEAAARAEAEAAAAKEREEAAARAAEERAKAEAEAAAERERQAERERHEAELAAERERAAAAEREAAAERQRAADEAAAREAERVRQEAEAQAERDRIAALEANQRHRTRCKSEAKQAIMTCGVDEDAAQKVVMLIIAGECPRVSLDFAAAGRAATDDAQPELV